MDPNRGFFPFVGGKKIKIKIYSLAVVGKFGLFSGDFDNILIEKIIIKKTSELFRMSEEKIKKCLNVNFFSCREQFWLVGGLVDHRIY